MNLTDLSRDELRKRASDLKIPGRGKMLKPELIAAIEARIAEIATETKPKALELIRKHIAERKAEKADRGKVVPNRAERRAKGMRDRVKAKPVIRGKVMPLHYRGRAIGAKHTCLRVAAKLDQPEFYALTVPIMRDIAAEPVKSIQELYGSTAAKS